MEIYEYDKMEFGFNESLRRRYSIFAVFETRIKYEWHLFNCSTQVEWDLCSECR